MDELKEIRDTLNECANSVDETIKLFEKEFNGDKITNEEKENVQGKMLMKFIKLQKIFEKR